MIATPQAATAALSLLLLAGLGHASYDCDPSAGLCLTTFRWCNPDSCQYPKNVKLLSDSGPVAYEMLRYDETYYVNWTTPSPEDEVFLTWYIPQFGSDDPPPLEWTRNTTENYVKFCPDDVIKEIVESERYNVTESNIRVMMTDIGNHIFIKQGNPFDSENPSGSADQSAQFSVQNWWAWGMTMAAEEIGAAREKRKWRLGVGVGVGLGVPLLLSITGLTTWWVTNRRTESRGKAKETP